MEALLFIVANIGPASKPVHCILHQDPRSAEAASHAGHIQAGHLLLRALLCWSLATQTCLIGAAHLPNSSFGAVWLWAIAGWRPCWALGAATHAGIVLYRTHLQVQPGS